MAIHGRGSNADVSAILTEVAGLDGEAMRGTDSAALASVLGALNSAEASGAVTTTDVAMAYIKQIVTNTELAVAHENHTTAIFPTATNLTCTLTADVNANEWEDWAEIVDSAAASLSTAFAANDGHITGMLVEDTNQDDTRFMFEIGYGDTHIIVARGRVLTETNKLSTAQIGRFRGGIIPAGVTIYARVMCATAAAKTLSVHFRYYLH